MKENDYRQMISHTSWPDRFAPEKPLRSIMKGMPEIPAPTVEELRARFEAGQARLNAAKIAYLNRSDFDGEPVSYEVLKRLAQETIKANYSLQTAIYGSVRLKLSVARLLRRGH
jgi:hypothetical protein